MKKEVILVNLAPGKNYSYESAGSIYPATGVMIIATILKKNGFSVFLIDGAVEPRYEEILLEKLSDRTAFVGFSTMTSQVVMAYRLAKKIKEKKPDALIVFGGVHPTLFPKQTVCNPYIDIAVINEGAKTVLDIMNYVSGKTQLEEIKGIAFRDKKSSVRVNLPGPLDDISEIPHFDFDLLDIQRYLNAISAYERELSHNGNKRLRLMPILTGLGCCFRCSFCINVILKRRYRIRSAQSIIEEIKRLRSRYDANAFLFLDEDFCIDKRRLTEFIQLAKNEKIKFSGRIWSRVSYFKQNSFKNILPQMENIGIRSIAMGAESGSQRMLDYLCKGIKQDDIICAAREISKVSITPRFSFMVGMEGERKEETMATYKLCAELLRINPATDIAGPFTFRYYPGSSIFQDMVQKYNIEIPRSIEEWDNAINDDGSLIVDAQQWTWPGFFRYNESMCNYIRLYVHTLSNLSYSNALFVKIVKKILLWRLMHGKYLYIIDYYILGTLKKIKDFLSISTKRRK